MTFAGKIWNFIVIIYGRKYDRLIAYVLIMPHPISSSSWKCMQSSMDWRKRFRMNEEEKKTRKQTKKEKRKKNNMESMLLNRRQRARQPTGIVIIVNVIVKSKSIVFIIKFFVGAPNGGLAPHWPFECHKAMLIFHSNRLRHSDFSFNFWIFHELSVPGRPKTTDKHEILID